ncbi:MAG: F0F1 ATP synthase subunit delta [Pseudomonadales bacterium]
MAELATLARPYANALFDLAKSEQALEQWSRMLSYLAAASADQRVKQMLESPDLATEVKAQRLTDLCGEELSDRAKNLIKLLARNKRLGVLGEIREQFEARKAEEERVLEVEVVSAYELSPEQSDRLREALQRKFEREVNLTGRVDPDMLGGAIIRAGDTVIDGSIRGRLDKLAETLQRS